MRGWYILQHQIAMKIVFKELLQYHARRYMFNTAGVLKAIHAKQLDKPEQPEVKKSKGWWTYLFGNTYSLKKSKIKKDD